MRVLVLLKRSQPLPLRRRTADLGHVLLQSHPGSLRTSAQQSGLLLAQYLQGAGIEWEGLRHFRFIGVANSSTCH